MRAPCLVIALAALCAAAPAPTGAGDAPPLRFTDVSETAGVAAPLRGMMAHCAAWGDVDGDGCPELFQGGFCDRPPGEYVGAAGPVPNRLLRALPGGRFERLPAPALEVLGRASGAVFADLDNDGDLDLYVSNNTVQPPGEHADPRRAAGAARSLLLENDGRGGFRDVSEPSGACPAGPFLARNIGVMDFDGDGLLDLLVVEDRLRQRRPRSRLFRNRGGLRFETANAAAGLPEDLDGLGLAIADLNGDGRPDFYVGESDRLFLSRGNGAFYEAPEHRVLFAWKPVDREDVTCGAAFGDLDRDGDFDLVVSNHHAPSRNRVYLNEGLKGGVPAFRDVTELAGLGRPVPAKTPHVEIQDFDNDGWPDIYLSAAAPRGAAMEPLVLRGLGPRGGVPRFQVPDLAAYTHYQPAAPTADFDGDGDLDLFLAEWWPERGSRLLRNEVSGRGWLQVRVRGERTNRMGIGARVALYRAGMAGRPEALLGLREIGTGYGYSSGQPAVAHFGLGGEKRVDVRVEVPGLPPLTVRETAANRLLELAPAQSGR